VIQNDLGIRTDVMDNIPKAIGMKMLIRSMNPKVIVADEIGSKEDVQAIEYAITSGVKGIFTAHGARLEEIKENPILRELILKNRIEKVLLLDSKRNIHLVYESQFLQRNREFTEEKTKEKLFEEEENATI
jgi:stage III sporulation protein AA